MKPTVTKKTPVKEEIVTPVRRSLVDAARSSPKAASITSSPSSRHSSRSTSPASHQQSSTVNPMKLAAAMKRLSKKPTDPNNSLKPSDALQKRTASPRRDILKSSAKETSSGSPLGRSLAETTPTASANSSRRSSISLEQADRQRALSPEPTGPTKDRRQSVLDMPKKPYHEENRNSLNTLEARLKSLQSSSKARKAALEAAKDPNPSGDARKKQTRFVLPSSKKFDKGGKP